MLVVSSAQAGTKAISSRAWKRAAIAIGSSVYNREDDGM
jgi:hypothetical protein